MYVLHGYDLFLNVQITFVKNDKNFLFTTLSNQQYHITLPRSIQPGPLSGTG